MQSNIEIESKMIDHKQDFNNWISEKIWDTVKYFQNAKFLP